MPAAGGGSRAREAETATRKAPVTLLLCLLTACSEPALESRRIEATFLPDGPTLERLEASLRAARHPVLAGHSLVDREPTEREEVRVFHDTGDLHLLNQGSVLYHAFVVTPGRPGESGWRYDRLLDHTRLWWRELRGDPQPLEEGPRPGTAILERIAALDYEEEIAERLRADLGWLPDLCPRVLLGITSKQWEYREPSSGDAFAVRIASVHASWWTPGTPRALDGIASLRAVAGAPLAVSWSELTIEREGPAVGREPVVPGELVETYGLSVVRTREPGYRRAVRLLSE